MGKEHLIPAKKGEVRNPQGNNQHTHTKEAKELAKALLGSEFDEVDDKALVEAIKMLQRKVAASKRKDLQKIAKSESLTVFAKALIETYTSKKGYEQMMRDFGLDKGAGLSVDMGEDTSITFRWVK